MASEKKPSIQVQHLTKQFNYWSDRPTSLKTVLVSILKGQFTFGEQVQFTALKDVSFDIFPGEFVGIMGRNGAGKSTLLKLIAGIYTPSSGQIITDGFIAPLIELGAGFQQDLSGYENIFLNASILGFGKKATMVALPAILEFAELGDMIHMPLRNYSTGMIVRLGFSIATHLEAPILLVDEVLAVGDVYFQNKCLKKIMSLHQAGRTIILITHDPVAVKTHCNRCIVISEQEKVFDGDVDGGVQEYLRLMSATP